MRAALVLVALLVAGCGGGAAAAPEPTPDAALAFSACMREHGVAEFPDPDGTGALTIDAVVNGTSIDPESEVFAAARDACRDLQPAGFTGKRRTESEQDTALTFAECIREHGVEDFPDPENGEPLVNTNLIPSAATDAGRATLNAAMQSCRKYADGR
jgi:hypothetical protein